MKDDCIFCKIIKGEIPSYTIYEDDNFKAFLDINPITNGHTLLVPKKHYDNLFDLDEQLIPRIGNVVKELNVKYKDKLGCEGLTLIQNNGIGQDVKHYHLHLVPRYEKDEIEYKSDKDLLKPVEDLFNELKD